MIERINYKEIASALSQYPIIALTGPRQSGKTTLLKSMFSEFRYINLETPDVRDFAIKDPKSFLSEYDSKVIFDEIQRAPELFSYLQATVDENGAMGQFILSGSQNFHLMERITQSLAGRVAMFKLFPFDLREMKTANWLSRDLDQLFVRGFYPALFE
ncbi:MAG: AAA family ATPase, partial [Bacteroidota bacterium]